jgi:predicted metal-dependent phosphoesterase TrpH
MPGTVISGHPGVSFAVPDHAALRREGYLAVDMHLHSRHSDGLPAVRDLLARARHQGFGLAITDHNCVSGAQAACSEETDITVVPGIEVSTPEGPHILFYFYQISDLLDFYHRVIEKELRENPWMAIRLPADILLERAGDYSCLIIAAHPFGYAVLNRGMLKAVEKRIMPPEVMHPIDGLEVICGGMSTALNRKAAEYSEEHHLAFTGGSDGHLLRETGTVVTCARVGDGPELLDAIRKRQKIVVGRASRGVGKGLSAGVIMGRFLPYTLPSLRIHYEQNIPRIWKKYVVRSEEKDDID